MDPTKKEWQVEASESLPNGSISQTAPQGNTPEIAGGKGVGIVRSAVETETGEKQENTEGVAPKQIAVANAATVQLLPKPGGGKANNSSATPPGTAGSAALPIAGGEDQKPTIELAPMSAKEETTGSEADPQNRKLMHYVLAIQRAIKAFEDNAQVLDSDAANTRERANTAIKTLKSYCSSTATGKAGGGGARGTAWEGRKKRLSRFEISAIEANTTLTDQLDKLGIVKGELDESFAKLVYARNAEDPSEVSMNAKRAAMLLQDTFSNRDPNHILTTDFDLLIYSWLSSRTVKRFFLLMGFVHLSIAFVEEKGYGLLSSNPSKYVWSATALLGIEYFFMALYGLNLLFILRVYRSIRSWNIAFLCIWFVSMVDLIYASAQKEPNSVMRITRALRPFFLVYRSRPMKDMISGFIQAAKRLLPLFVFIILLLILQAVVGVSMFPRSCGDVESAGARVRPPACQTEDWISLFSSQLKNNISLMYSSNGSQTLDVICESEETPVQLCKELKSIPGAYYAQGQNYFDSLYMSVLQLLYLLFGSVNYPDVQMPAVLTLNYGYILYFATSLLMGILFLNMVLAEVFQAWKTGSEKSFLHNYRRQRTALIECFVVMDQDGSGTIDFEEFRAVVELVRKETKEDYHLLSEIFGRVNSDGDDVLTLSEFFTVCDALWLMKTKEEKFLHASMHDIPPHLTVQKFSRLDRMAMQHFNDARKMYIGQHCKTVKKTSCFHRVYYQGLFPSLRTALRSKWVEAVFLVVVLFTVVAFYGEIDSTLKCDGTSQKHFQTMQWVGIVLLSLEVILKVLAVGARGYFGVGWWRFDLLTLLAAIVGNLIHAFIGLDRCVDPKKTEGMFSYSFGSFLKTTVFLRLLRIFRYVAQTQSIPGSSTLRLMRDSLLAFAPNIWPFFCLYVSIVYIYAILGVYAFGGDTLRYEGKSIGGFKAAGDFSFKEGDLTINVRGPYLTVITFDSFHGAVLTLWSVTILNNWHLIHEVHIGHFQDESSKYMVTTYFVSWILVSVCLWMNLVISAFLATYGHELDKAKANSTHANRTQSSRVYLRGLSEHFETTTYYNRFLNMKQSLLTKLEIVLKESFGATRVCALSGKSYPSEFCPYMILPTCFDDIEPRPVSFRAFIQMCDSGIGEKEEFSVKKTDSLQKQINKHEGLLDVEMDVMRKATAQH